MTKAGENSVFAAQIHPRLGQLLQHPPTAYVPNFDTRVEHTAPNPTCLG
jgi:hypothetical protein